MTWRRWATSSVCGSSASIRNASAFRLPCCRRERGSAAATGVLHAADRGAAINREECSKVKDGRRDSSAKAAARGASKIAGVREAQALSEPINRAEIVAADGETAAGGPVIVEAAT